MREGPTLRGQHSLMFFIRFWARRIERSDVIRLETS